MKSACGWQKYWYLPGFVNVWPKLVSAPLRPDSNFSGWPGLLVEVCSVGALKFQVTVSPGSIVMFSRE